MIDSLDFSVQKFEGYSILRTLNTSENCSEVSAACVQSCTSIALCRALLIKRSDFGCEAVQMISYGRVLLIPTINSTVFVKSMSRQWRSQGDRGVCGGTKGRLFP